MSFTLFTFLARRLILLAIALPALGQTLPVHEQWVGSWGHAQQNIFTPRPPGPGSGPPRLGLTESVPLPPSPPAGTNPGNPNAPRAHPPAWMPQILPAITNQSLRMIVRTSIGGERVRVRFANPPNSRTVRIAAASIAHSSGEGKIHAPTLRSLTFGGDSAAKLYGGAVLLSDPVDLPTERLSDLAITLYIEGEVTQPNFHYFGWRNGYLADGNATMQTELRGAQPFVSYYWLEGVDVLAPANAGTVVTFGDSITDGGITSLEKSAMWPAVLAERLQRGAGSRHLGVVNSGIAANRLMGDTVSGLARLEAHALAIPGARWIILLEGINDISFGERVEPGLPVTVETLIAAYEQVIAHAHQRGIRVMGATLIPYGGSRAFTPDGEKIRNAINTWIRTSGRFDAVVDFDAAVRDPADPSKMRIEAESSDGLHPGDGGHRLMAEAVDLEVLTHE